MDEGSKHEQDSTGAERQRVVIPNKYGEKLVGILHETGSRDIVIVCHGMLSSKDTNIIFNLAVALENAKISAFRFDFSGNGESEGSFDRNDFWKEVDDILVVAQHFRESNRNISAIVGHSKGGDIVLLYASKYGDIEKVVNIAGRYDTNRRGTSDLPVSEEESVMDGPGINMHDECLKIDKKCSVLTVHGSADETNPLEDAFEFAKIIPNHKLHVIEGADHFFTNYQQELSSVLVNFIKETLHHVKATAN